MNMKLKAIPSAIFKANGILPGADSQIRLPAGTYTLGSDSTVPFVKFIGSSFGEKVITWNEKVHIPKNENTRVVNASYHMGDIYITNDLESYTRPARITVPFDWSIPLTEVEEGDTVTPAWNKPGRPIAKADCRMARRVFAAVIITIGEDYDPGEIRIYGQQKLHSHLSAASLGLANGFAFPLFAAPNSTVYLMPLGYVAPNNYSPMALLDTAWFDLTWAESGVQSYIGGYYIIEY
jgi:hypothetical protein